MNTRNTRSSAVVGTSVPPQLQNTGKNSNLILYVSTGISVLVVLTVATVIGISLILCLRKKKRVRRESTSEKDTSKSDMDTYYDNAAFSIRANTFDETLNHEYDYVDFFNK